MLQELHYFVEVVRCASFTEAAQQLDVSRSLISKKITQLEQDLGTRLLNRSTRSLSLTEAGEQFYQRCKQGLAEIDLAVDEVQGMNEQPRGQLAINLPSSFGTLHVAPLLPEFRRRYPDIRLNLNFEDRKIEMIEPGFDLSIRISDIQDSSLNARRIGPCKHLVVASPSYLKQAGTPKQPHDLSQAHTIISYRLQEQHQNWRFEGPQGQCDIRLEPQVLANSSLAIKQILLNGGGIARVPSFLVGEELRQGSLIALLTEYTCPEKSIYALFPKREYMPQKTRVFIDFLVEAFGEPLAWDVGA